MRKMHFWIDDIALPALLGVLTLIMIIGSPITLGQGLSFFLYQIFSVMMPGMVVYQLLQVPRSTALERALCGYALGYILVIVEYFLFAVFHMLYLLRFFQIILAICSLGFLILFVWKGKYVLQESNTKKDWLQLTVFCFLVFSIRYVTYYGLNILPSAGQNVTFSTQDILFYIGNAISAKKKFPLEEFRFAGQVFKYHYFGSIQLAVASLATGIDVLSLETCLEWIQHLILLISTAFLLLRRMNMPRGIWVLGMGILFFTTGRESLVYVTYQHIMYKTPFGYDVGLAMGILFVIFLYLQHESEKFQWGLFGGVMLSFFSCEGSKAPIAVVLLVLAGCMCGIWFLTPKRRKWAFLYGLCLIFLFVAVFFLFVSDGLDTVTTNATGLRFDLTGHLYECGLGKLYFEWTSRGISGIVGKVLVLFLYFFGCNMAAYYLMVFLTGKALIRKTVKMFSFEGCMFVTVCFGLVLTLITKQQGNSQMYFAMVSFPLAVFLSMNLWSKQRNLMRINLSSGVFLVLLLCSFVSFIQVLLPDFQEGIEKLRGADTFIEGSNSLTYEEKIAYDWMRNTTAEDAICVTNVILEDDQYESFIVGVCTERQMYMEGWRYVAGYVDEESIAGRRETVREFFENEAGAWQELQDFGVEYVIWVNRYADLEVAWQPLSGTKVYENQAATIYNISN